MSTMGVVLVGIAIVFICMIIITLILSAFPFLMGSGKKKKEKQTVPEELPVVPTPVEAVTQNSVSTGPDNEELIAVITAAVAACLGDSRASGFRVASFRRIGDNAPVWARTGRLENLTE